MVDYEKIYSISSSFKGKTHLREWGATMAGVMNTKLHRVKIVTSKFDGITRAVIQLRNGFGLKFLFLKRELNEKGYIISVSHNGRWFTVPNNLKDISELWIHSMKKVQESITDIQYELIACLIVGRETWNIEELTGFKSEFLIPIDVKRHISKTVKSSDKCFQQFKKIRGTNKALRKMTTSKSHMLKYLEKEYPNIFKRVVKLLTV